MKNSHNGKKTIVLIRLLEFVYTHEGVNADEEEFVNTVASTFNFDMEEYKLAKFFVQEDETELLESPNVMYITDSTDSGSIFGKHISSAGMEGYIRVLRLPSVNLHFVKYMGSATSYNISGQLIVNDRFYVLNQGASIRGPKN
jgi:ABC transport system ATP-binding/permease protein